MPCSAANVQPMNTGTFVLLLPIACLVCCNSCSKNEQLRDASVSAKPSEAGRNLQLEDSIHRPRVREGGTENIDGDRRVKKIFENGTYESSLLSDLLEPFDQEELVQLAAHPEKDTGGRLVRLILHAVADRDTRFQYMLDQKELRNDPEIDLALLAYDYSVNHNESALKTILSQHATQVNWHGWDSGTVLVLAYVDEWKLTKEALEAHVMSGDGSGADAAYSFWLTRRYLFPKDQNFPRDYRQFRNDLHEKQQESESGLQE